MTWILQSATILTIDLDLATLCEDLTIWQTGDNGKRNLVLARIWQGSILPRPLTYNLGLKSLKILYQKALCVESMIQNGPKGEKVSRQESYTDLLWSTPFTFFSKTMDTQKHYVSEVLTWLVQSKKKNMFKTKMYKKIYYDLHLTPKYLFKSQDC